MSNKNELIQRMKAKKKQLEADLAEARADSSAIANTRKEELQGKVDEISDGLKQANENFTEAVAKKFNEWLR